MYMNNTSAGIFAAIVIPTMILGLYQLGNILNWIENWFRD